MNCSKNYYKMYNYLFLKINGKNRLSIAVVISIKLYVLEIVAVVVVQATCNL